MSFMALLAIRWTAAFVVSIFAIPMSKDGVWLLVCMENLFLIKPVKERCSRHMCIIKLGIILIPSTFLAKLEMHLQRSFGIQTELTSTKLSFLIRGIKTMFL